MKMNNEATIKIVSQLDLLYGDSIDQQEVKSIIERVLSDYDLTIKETLPAILDNMSDRILIYLASRKIEGLSKNSLEHYSRVLGRFKHRVVKNVEDVTTMDVRMYIHDYSETGVSNSTISNHTDIIRRFFQWLVDEEYIDRNPLSKIATIKKEQRLRKALTREEFAILRSGAKTLRQKALIELFYSTGCRLEEVENMKKNDIDLNDMKATVIGKGNKQRTVYIDVEAKLALKKYFMSRLDESESVFVTSRKPIKALGRDAIRKEIKKIQEQSGLNKNVYPHLIRHTFSTHKLNSGMNIEVLQQLLGHEDIGTTQVYAQVSNREIEYQYRKYN